MDEAAGSSTVAIAAASTVIMANRSGRRIAFSISNYGAATVFLTMSNTQLAAANSGIALYPGMTISDSSSDIYKCFQGTVSGYEAGGAGTLSVWERVNMD